MSSTYIIDGVGDEVTITFGILLAVLVVVATWLSTRVNDPNFADEEILRTSRQTHSDASQSENQSTTERDRSPTAQSFDTSEDPIREDFTPSSTLGETSGLRQRPIQGHQAEQPSLPVDVTPSSTLDETSGLRQRPVQGQQAEQPSLPVDVTPSSTLDETSGLRQRPDQGHQAEQPSLPVQSPSPSDPSIPLGISIRLKFMDETLQTVQASPDETLESFRRRHLPAETWNRYRLIYRGQVLRDGSQTLRQLNLTGNTSGDGSFIPVIHCFLAPAATTDGPNLSASQQMQWAAEDLHIGSLMLPVLGICLLCMWYLCIFHTSLFSIQSVVSIVGFTFLYTALIVNHFS